MVRGRSVALDAALPSQPYVVADLALHASCWTGASSTRHQVRVIEDSRQAVTDTRPTDALVLPIGRSLRSSRA